MPTQTFFNLQSDKQNKILDVSKKEFSKYGFYEASINRIIKEAGISRGSFYQYFESKEDLFLYIIDNFKSVITKLISEKLNDKKSDIFEFHLLIFDIITKNGFSGEDREFIVTTTSNINIKLVNHLLGFSPQKEISEELEEINKFINLDNIKYNTNEELINIYTILMNATMYIIIIYFSNFNSYEGCRKDLINQFELIKYGILK